MIEQDVRDVQAIGSVAMYEAFTQEIDRLCRVSRLIAELDESMKSRLTSTASNTDAAKLLSMLELSNRDIRQFCRLTLGAKAVDLVDCLLVSRKLVNELYRYFTEGPGSKWNAKRIFDALMGSDNFYMPAEIHGDLEARLFRRQLVILHVLYSILCVARQKTSPQELLVLGNAIEELSSILRSELDAVSSRVESMS